MLLGGGGIPTLFDKIRQNLNVLIKVKHILWYIDISGMIFNIFAIQFPNINVIPPRLMVFRFVLLDHLTVEKVPQMIYHLKDLTQSFQNL